MPSTSEQGYGARLQNAQTLKTFLQSFTNYNPTRKEDALTEFENLLQRCAEINPSVASLVQSYTLAIKSRVDIFAGSQASSLRLLLSPISKSVQAHYGKNSREYTSIANIVNKMRSTKLAKSLDSNEEEIKNTISQSELSYGSQYQNFKDLVASLEQLEGYNPSNELVKIASLKTTIETIGKLNNEVISKTIPLNQAREQRKNLFIELNTRTQRIKSYISAMYGNKSIEYKSISKLKI
jgi:hypothetical protein